MAFELTEAGFFHRIGLGLAAVAGCLVVGQGLFASPMLSAAVGLALSIALLADLIFGLQPSLPKTTLEFFSYSALGSLLMAIERMM